MCIIDHGQLKVNKTDGWALIGIPEREDVTLSDHDNCCIHDDLFDRIQSTRQNRNFLWKFISNESNEDEYQSGATEIHNNKIQNKKRTANKYPTNNTLQRKRQKSVDYSNNSFDDFRVMIVDPPPKMNSNKSYVLDTCYSQSMENK